MDSYPPNPELRKETVMAYVITDSCVKDNLCSDSCPGDAIHPTKNEPAYEAATQLYINPAECMDCGACIAECPTGSIFSADELPADKKDFAEKNANFFN
ncbi:MAG TPA: ferredoxin family protein [Candidatus Saccharimonadales bacterium]|nr:ferredoxin family protein [Candidatus Saccharimonadales bacterium]